MTVWFLHFLCASNVHCTSLKSLHHLVLLSLVLYRRNTSSSLLRKRASIYVHTCVFLSICTGIPKIIYVQSQVHNSQLLCTYPPSLVLTWWHIWSSKPHPGAMLDDWCPYLFPLVHYWMVITTRCCCGGIGTGCVLPAAAGSETWPCIACVVFHFHFSKELHKNFSIRIEMVLQTCHSLRR